MGKNNTKMMSEINITSLVDVSITLLIIFMLSAPLLKTGIDVSLPRTAAAKFHEKEGLTITINKNKEIFIGDTKTDIESFTKKLEKRVLSESYKIVYLKSDKGVPYGFVIDIVGKIKLAGVENLGLSTEKVRKKR